MVRGINKADIFDDGQEKTRFLERLGDLVREGQCRVYAWVLMSNHVHILFKSGKHGKTIEKLIGEECRKQGISPMELKGGGNRRKVSDTRAIIALRSRDELGLSAAEIARHVGVNTSGVTKAIERAEKRDGYKYPK